MHDTICLPKGPVRAEGRVTVQYRDGVTGKVLGQSRGGNHVFTAQLGGTTAFQTSAMCADLVLCRGGTYPDPGGEMKMPFIPGEPIGYGRPGAEGTGLYRGTYRAGESWCARVTKTSVSSKFVYDFLPTQALGRVDWVGLTAGLGTGIAAPCYTPPDKGFSSAARVYDCGGHRYFRAAALSADGGYHAALYHKDPFEEEDERVVDVSALAGLTALRTSNSYPRTFRVFYDNAEKTAYVLLRGTPVGVTAAVCKVVKVDLAGNFLGVWDITDGKELSYAVSSCGAARAGKLYWMVPASGYRGYTRYVCDVEAGSVTAVEVALEESSPNLLRWEEGVAFLYGDCFWYPRRDGYLPSADSASYSGYFLYGSPLFDLASGAVHGLLPPSPMEKTAGGFHVGPSPIAAFSGQWLKTAGSGGSLAMPFAYTCYAMPEGTAERPAGSAMTVSYELDVTW